MSDDSLAGWRPPTGQSPQHAHTLLQRQRRAEEKKLNPTPEEIAKASRNHLANYWRELPMSPHNVRMRPEVPGGWRLSSSPDQRKKVALCGAGLGKNEAPLEDPSWQVWTLNAVAPCDDHRRFRADVWFDLHQRFAQNADDMKWIAECPFPLFVPPDLVGAGPMTLRFPLEEIEAKFGSYFSCSFAYMLALVLLNGDITDVGLFGAELAYGTMRERTVEFACVSYWLGRVEQAGIRIHLPEQSMLGRHFARYGFEYNEEIDATQGYVDFMQECDDLRKAQREKKETTHA